MEPSRLKLLAYHLKSLQILPYEDAEAVPLGQYADFHQVEFSSEVQHLEMKDEGSEELKHGLALKLSVDRGDNKNFPYAINLEAVGVFDASALPAERQVPLVLVNGASMLYSALREVLLMLTQRCMHGPVMLPSVHFVQLEKDYLQSQAVQVDSNG
jgi:preprotein translocase subunit SecB